jgi:hypothetical protein
MKRVYRGDSYVMQIVNKNKGQSKVNRIIVDGKEIIGNEFNIFKDGKEHHILVEMD